MSINKILAEFMGWEVTYLGDKLLTRSRAGGQFRSLANFSRDDLQLVVEKLTPDQHSRFWELKARAAIDTAPYPSEGVEATWQAMDNLPTTTLARLVSEVIEGSNSDGQ